MNLYLIISNSLIILSILKLVQHSRKKTIYLYSFLLIIISFFHLLYLVSDQLTNNGITYEIAYRNEYWIKGKGTQIFNEAISRSVIASFLFLFFIHLFFLFF